MIRIALAGLVGTTLLAQAPTVPFVVLTRLVGAPASALLEVDPATGVATPLGGFVSDGLPPLAVAVDPFDGALFVAVDAGASTSLVLRLVRAGSGFAEFPLATVPGRVAQLDTVGERLLIAVDAANGGLLQLPRRGGAVTVALAQPNLTAVHGFGWNGTAAAVAWTGRPGSAVAASGTAVLDVATSAFWWGPDTFPNPTGRETTGVVDLPTAVPRQLLAFDDGTFALFAGLIGPTLQPVATVPPVPPGGAVALKTVAGHAWPAVALGGAPFPFLYEIEPWSGAVTLRSAALPGMPVDFAAGVDRAAHTLWFGAGCGASPVQWASSGDAVLGTTLTLTGTGQPNAVLVLALGLDDYVGGLLPAALPFAGCTLQVAPDVLLAYASGPSGVAAQALAIPASPAFTGTPLFVQWGQLDASGLSLAAAVVHVLGS